MNTVHVVFKTVYVGMMVAGLLLAAKNHDEPRSPENFWLTLVASAIQVGILIGCGFFG
jgi:hypothetical protein